MEFSPIANELERTLEYLGFRTGHLFAVVLPVVSDSPKVFNFIDIRL